MGNGSAFFLPPFLSLLKFVDYILTALLDDKFNRTVFYLI